MFGNRQQADQYEQQGQGQGDALGQIALLAVIVFAAFVCSFLLVGVIFSFFAQRVSERPEFWWWGRVDRYRWYIASACALVCAGVVVSVYANYGVGLDAALWNLLAGFLLVPLVALTGRGVLAQRVSTRRISDVSLLARIERAAFVAADRRAAWESGLRIRPDGDVEPRGGRVSVVHGPQEVEQ